jgi:hypothetical protein
MGMLHEHLAGLLLSYLTVNHLSMQIHESFSAKLTLECGLQALCIAVSHTACSWGDAHCLLNIAIAVMPCGTL